MDMVGLSELIEELAEQWQTMPRGSDEEKAHADTFYQESVFPAVLELFRQREGAKIRVPYDGLIMPVGGSPEALILSISALRPRQVAFLYTEWSHRFLDKIIQATDLKPTQYQKDLIDEHSTLDTYRLVKKVYEVWAGRQHRIAVDISGGKKSMTGGATLAAHVIGADVVYVDSEQFWQGFGKPKPGSEFLTFLPHPYQVFGDLEVRRAARLFEGFDYIGAKRIFQELASKVPEPLPYFLWQLLAGAYAAWDVFDFEEADRTFSVLIDELERRSMVEKRLPLSDRIQLLRTQALVLGQLKAVTKEIKAGVPLAILKDRELVKSFLFSLYHNALRREQQGRFDMAALLLYRVLELMGQRRLGLRGFDTVNPDFMTLGILDIDRRYREAFQQRASWAAVTPHLPPKIDLTAAYVLLDVIGDPLVAGLNWKRLFGQVTARNHSMFAHGFRVLTEQDFQQYKLMVEGLVAVFCKIEGLNRVQLDQEFCFMTPLGDLIPPQELKADE